jgi:hypothetical protein
MQAWRSPGEEPQAEPGRETQSGRGRGSPSRHPVPPRVPRYHRAPRGLSWRLQDAPLPRPDWEGLSQAKPGSLGRLLIHWVVCRESCSTRCSHREAQQDRRGRALCRRRPSCSSRLSSCPPPRSAQPHRPSSAEQGRSLPMVGLSQCKGVPASKETPVPKRVSRRGLAETGTLRSKQKTPLEPTPERLCLAVPKHAGNRFNVAPQVVRPFQPAEPADQAPRGLPPQLPGRRHPGLAPEAWPARGECLSELPSLELILTRSSCVPELL